MNLAKTNDFDHQLMKKTVKYTIFSTNWGCFGIAANNRGLLRTHLPAASPEIVKSRLLKNLGGAEYDKNLFRPLQKQITAYFEGTCVNFGKDIPLDFGNLTEFSRLVLNICRSISFGQTISYAELAKRAGRPHAVRAVGNVLAQNPLPLIIPCHRVIYSNGNIGGFSAIGGVKIKKLLLCHEQKCFLQGH